MAARALWKGVLRLGRSRIGVRLYSAIDEPGVHFRLLHESDRAPVRQSLIDPESGEEVERKQVQKGYEVDRGVLVVFSKEELDALEPPDSRDIEPVKFVPQGSVEPLWLDRPYWLGPDEGGSADFAALVVALAESGRDGIVRWVMRDRERVGLLHSDGEHLVLITLRHTSDVVRPKDIDVSLSSSVGAKELKLAEQLVAALDEKFEPLRHGDDYATRVAKLVAAKARGKRIPRRASHRRKPAPRNLSSALEASVRAAEKRKARG